MSSSDLDYVNAAVSRSEQLPRAGENGATPTTEQSDPAGSGLDGAPDAESRSTTLATASSRPPGPASTAEGRSADTTEVGQPSLASLLASLQTATLDAQSLGISPTSDSKDPTTTTEGDEDLDEDGDLDLDSLKALLAKLDETEGAADDLEGRLDGLIDNLDALLGAIGGVALPSSSTSATAAHAETEDTEKK